MKKRLKDKKIQILKGQEFAEPGDMPVYVFAPIHEGTLWAYVRQLSANEHYAAMQVEALEEMLFVVNWRDDIDPLLCYVKYKDRYYNIKRVDTYEGYKGDIQLFADGGTLEEPTA